MSKVPGQLFSRERYGELQRKENAQDLIRDIERDLHALRKWMYDRETGTSSWTDAVMTLGALTVGITPLNEEDLNCKFYSPAEMYTPAGTTKTVDNGWGVVDLGTTGSTKGVYITCKAPKHWTTETGTITVSALHTLDGTDAGDIDWQLTVEPLDAGDLVTGAATATDVTQTTGFPAADTLALYSFTTGLIATPVDDYLSIYVGKETTTANTDNIYLHGVFLEFST